MQRSFSFPGSALAAAWLAGLCLAFLSGSPGHAAPLDEAIGKSFADGELPGLHAALIDLGDTRLAEVYFSGKDEIWGVPVGEREFGPDTLHDLRSVTKSVVGLLYGIALEEGKVPDPESPLYAAFPEYPDLASDPERKPILIGHALSMQMGLEWNEDLPYSDPRNSEIAMENAAERYRFALDRPVVEAPGGRWIYSGGAVALIARLIEKGTGMAIDDYAREKLFAPLGITRFEWVKGADGVPSAASGLRLTLPDLARIGHMVAGLGLYEGQRVVPEAWLARSMRPRAEVAADFRYGYLWYLTGPADSPVAVAVGNGGQRLTVQPKAGLVVASFAGRYNDPESWRTSLRILLDFAVPEARRRLSK